MKTITKLLVQLEITKATRDFKHINAQEFRTKVERTRVVGGDMDRARSMPHQLGTWFKCSIVVNYNFLHKKSQHKLSSLLN